MGVGPFVVAVGVELEGLRPLGLLGFGQTRGEFEHLVVGAFKCGADIFERAVFVLLIDERVVIGRFEGRAVFGLATHALAQAAFPCGEVSQHVFDRRLTHCAGLHHLFVCEHRDGLHEAVVVGLDKGEQRTRLKGFHATPARISSFGTSMDFASSNGLTPTQLQNRNFDLHLSNWINRDCQQNYA